MIALLRGTVVSTGAGEVVLDVHGVGYRVKVTEPGTLASLGAEVVLHTHLAVREDALTLYGFADAPTRELFETLLTVTGLGPKLALTALGTLGGEGLRRAVITEDVPGLMRIPGVGRKGAQRMILELRERLGRLDEATTGAPPGPVTGGQQEVREALEALGYGPAEVAGALEALPASAATEAGSEELLRQALRALGQAARGRVG